MFRMPSVQRGAFAPVADRHEGAAVPAGSREARMARFAAGSRLSRLLVVGGLIAVGWVLGVVFGFAGEAHASTGTVPSPVVAGSVQVTDGFPTAGDAQAMAGRNVDGLTSSSTPVAPPPASAEHSQGNGLVPPNGGGSILFGDVARSFSGPRPAALPVPTAAVLPPVVRTAADDPSFSPD